jgi:hypothetical protein
MLTLEEAITHCIEVAEKNEASYKAESALGLGGYDCKKCADDHRQLAEWLKRLKRIEDYIADGKDDMECTYSLCFWEIEAVMNGEI